MEYIELGSAPSNEDCVQVSPDINYLPAMREECERYAKLITRIAPPPDGAHLGVKRFSHDFGAYLEVVVYYDDKDADARSYAYNLESNLPSNWS